MSPQNRDATTNGPLAQETVRTPASGTLGLTAVSITPHKWAIRPQMPHEQTNAVDALTNDPLAHMRLDRSQTAHELTDDPVAHNRPNSPSIRPQSVHWPTSIRPETAQKATNDV